MTEDPSVVDVFDNCIPTSRRITLETRGRRVEVGRGEFNGAHMAATMGRGQSSTK